MNKMRTVRADRAGEDRPEFNRTVGPGGGVRERRAARFFAPAVWYEPIPDRYCTVSRAGMLGIGRRFLSARLVSHTRRFSRADAAVRR